MPLLSDHPVYVVVSSGGYVNGERARQPDFLTLYLKAVFATIGINNVNFIALEAASRSAELRQQAFAQARKQMADLL